MTNKQELDIAASTNKVSLHLYEEAESHFQKYTKVFYLRERA